MSNKKDKDCCEEYTKGAAIINGALAYCQNHGFDYTGMPYWKVCPYCGKVLTTNFNTDVLTGIPDEELPPGVWLPLEVFSDYKTFKNESYFVGLFIEGKLISVYPNASAAVGWTHIMRLG